MNVNILDLLNVIKKEKDFFEKEKNNFVENFAKELFKEVSKTKNKILSINTLFTIGEKLYILLFLYKKDPQNELYNFSYKVAKSKIDLKKVLIKSTMRLTRDFIDYTLKKNEDYEKIKTLLSLIDIYLVNVDRAYAKYYEEIEDELNHVKNNKKREDEELIISLIQNIIKNDRKVVILDFYKEVPVSCKSIIKRLEKNLLFLDIQKCNFNIFKENKEIFLKIESFPKSIKAKIKSMKEFEYIEISDFEFTELPQEKRKYVRVQPKEKILVKIEKNGTKIDALINDISIGGIGIYADSIEDLEPNDDVLIKFELGENKIAIKGIVKYSLIDLKKVGIEFILIPELENEIAEYVLEREFEIIRELRI
ncbi:PilZ domain-containing protein [Nitrosophilus kaiyonis]|uniref:PilZ domain-containing protein n=1 Tax=Nitrosophilus kaiyonis TaxID=2930200 RepID=UPI00249184B2|nr:PilZ domain-containing protein [Nitrosophilus kaiyonis]